MGGEDFLLRAEPENVPAALWNLLCTVGPVVPSRASLVLCDRRQVAELR